MAKRKPKSPIEGRWNILSMTGWDQEYLHVRGPAFIEFSPNNIGKFHFGYVQGQMAYHGAEKGGKPAVEFTWEGVDEMEPESGHGWAAPEGDALVGVLAFEHGDESGFKAQRMEPRAKRTSQS